MVGPLADLMRAWHVWLNNQDFSSLISPEFVLNEYNIPVTPGTNYRSNVVFSVELESFTLKNTVIKTGSNVLNNNAELQLTYFQASLVPFNLMFFAVYNCFLVIHPESGVTTMEF